MIPILPANTTWGVEAAKINANFTLQNINLSTWYGKKLCSYGDSITYGNIWQPKLMELLGITTHYLRGVGGCKIVNSDADTYFVNADGSYYGETAGGGSTEITSAMATQARVNTIPEDTELLIIMGGSNDDADAGTLADAAASDTTLYAGFHQMLTYIYARVPSARVVLLGFPFHATSDLVTSFDGYDTKRVIIENIAKAYGYPFINLRKECGWNTNNYTTYLADTVHPNSVGGQRMAEVIAGELRKIQPYV